MIVLALPLGSAHGWGNCGRWLTREMARRTNIHLLPSRELRPEAFSNEIEFAFFSAMASRSPALSVPPDKLPERVSDPVFRGIELTEHAPAEWTRPRGQPNVAYTFFDRPTVTPQQAENVRRHFDCVLTGSTYCTEVLKQHDVSAGTLIQGVDPETFHPLPDHRKLFPHHFLIFSGGKFEFRKGQDLVVRAVKVMQERHRDVALVAAWHNYYQKAHQTMAQSSYITLPPPPPPEQQGDYRFFAQRVLEINGVNMNGVILIPRRPQETMAAIYHETDVGLFPSRCESGTNLVLMEYMACGKPAIASWTSGHRDVLNDENALVVRSTKPVEFRGEDDVPVTWDDPSLDEIVEKLEWAYQNRDALRGIGQRGARDLSRLTWGRMADDLYGRLTGAKPLAD
jgi:glycosyltransferase involved in cell wall biosynthesis